MLLLLACTHPIALTDPVEDAGGTAASESDGARVFDRTALHEIAITLDDADWDALRTQTRTYYDLLGDGCMQAPFSSPYTWFEADVRFDGEDLGTVGVRKKGLIGSLSEDRPSLRIDTDRFGGDARLDGLEKLVLNNNNQDPSRMRSCLAHAFFADAGLVAPRCSLAHVTVNGADLGVYDAAESIDEDLVERVLGAPPTSLYEGALSDFREGWMDTFEPETDDSDGGDLAAVTDALQADDATLLDTLDGVLDLDQFFTFWAAESLAGHWDGYDGNTNNFYAYGSPEDGRIRFVASGPDAAFDSREPFGAGQPVWVTTTSALANRLIRLDEGRARYEAELRRLLDDVWDEDGRLATLDAWSDLIRDDTTRDERQAARDLRDVVAARGGDVADSLGEAFDPPDLRGEFCWTDVGTVRVSFETTWGSYPGDDPFTSGTATTEYVISGTTYPTTANGVTAGVYDSGGIFFTVSTIAEGTYLAAYVMFDPEQLADGVDLALDGHPVQGALLYYGPDTAGQWQTAAWLGGTFHLDSGSDRLGDTLVGTLDATVLGSEG